MSSATEPSPRLTRWRTAWESRDPDRVAALYRADATHRSARVAQVCPELGTTTLCGVAQIRDYAARGLARFDVLRFEILWSADDGERSVVEYDRHSNLDAAPARVIEVIEWQGEMIRAVRVFHP